MAWDGSVIYQIGKDFAIIELTNFDADGESSSIIDLRHTIGFIPSRYTMAAKRTAGATAVISVDLKGYMYGSGGNGVDLITITGSAGSADALHTQLDGSGADDIFPAFPKLQVVVDTVGAGNTLTIEVLCVK
jgi:hypothetical protein